MIDTDDLARGAVIVALLAVLVGLIVWADREQRKCQQQLNAATTTADSLRVVMNGCMGTLSR
jgi:hypothetical protein